MKRLLQIFVNTWIAAFSCIARILLAVIWALLIFVPFVVAVYGFDTGDINGWIPLASYIIVIPICVLYDKAIDKSWSWLYNLNKTACRKIKRGY